MADEICVEWFGDDDPCRFIVGKDGKEWYVLEDLELELRINYGFLDWLPDCEKRCVTVDSYEGPRRMTAVSKHGHTLYRYYLRGRIDALNEQKHEEVSFKNMPGLDGLMN